MDSITMLIASEIKKQYKNIRQFSKVSGIPYSTLSNALSKGIGGTSFDTVNKICRILNLKQAFDTDLTVFNDQFHEMCAMFHQLDDRAVHTVKTVLKVEYERCTKDKAQAHNGQKAILLAKRQQNNTSPNTNDETSAD